MQDAAEAGQMSLGGQALAICSAHPALKNTSATSIARSSPSRCRSFKPMTENSPSSKAGKVVTSSVMVRSISRRLSKGPTLAKMIRRFKAIRMKLTPSNHWSLVPHPSGAPVRSMFR